MDKVNISKKLSQFDEHWSPKIIAELNGQEVKLAKIKGEFDWHSHADEDEMFLVIAGTFTMEYRDRSVVLTEGELVVVPRGVEHRPVAVEECSIMLFEPAGVVNTGDAPVSGKTNAAERI
jgi:mannose-6-phosphate isomerase-like protein (cupin superfamily)